MVLMVTGIVFSCLTVSSCHFIKYVDSNGNQGAVGLYRYFDTTTSSCINHDDSVSYSESENAARTGAVVAPMAASATILILLIEFCCCRFICSRLLMGLGLIAALVMQGITFLIFDSEKFCNGDIITEIMHQEPCTVADGAVFSAVAMLLYFMSGVLVFCTPKPEPMRVKKDVETSSSHMSVMTANSSIQSPSVTMNDVENTPMGSSKSASWT